MHEIPLDESAIVTNEFTREDELQFEVSAKIVKNPRYQRADDTEWYPRHKKLYDDYIREFPNETKLILEALDETGV